MTRPGPAERRGAVHGAPRPPRGPAAVLTGENEGFGLGQEEKKPGTPLPAALGKGGGLECGSSPEQVPAAGRAAAVAPGTRRDPHVVQILRCRGALHPPPWPFV